MSEIIKSEYNALGEDNNYKTHYFKTSADQVVGLGRMKNTEYQVGNVVYSDTNLSVALKCTNAGTTSNTELDISSRAVGESVEDGSVVWKVIERSNVLDEGGVIPIANGGTGATTCKDAISNLHSVGVFSRSDMGNVVNIDNPNVNGLFEIRGNEIEYSGNLPMTGYYPLLSLKSADNVAMLQIAGINSTDWMKEFYIRGGHASNVNLEGVVWSRLLTDGVVGDYIVESYNDGQNWYDVYKSGKVRQGGSVAKTNNYQVVNFLKPFANTNYTVLSVGGMGTNGQIDGNNNDLRTFGKTTTSFGSYNLHPVLDWIAEGQGA